LDQPNRQRNDFWIYVDIFQDHDIYPRPFRVSLAAREFFFMNSQLVEAASKVIIEPQVLVNMVSKRVRQLSAGSRPMVPVEGRMGLSDIALAEIAEGKLGLVPAPVEATN
jgi:DNA-directed RNA polymerase subunit omega